MLYKGQNLGEAAKIRNRVNPAEWETFRRCRFVAKTFHPYPCLARPLNEEGEGTFHAPYRGQPYDPEEWDLIEDAWDHEYCDVCRATITDGDVYWANDGPEHVDLCVVCYHLVQLELQA